MMNSKYVFIALLMLFISHPLAANELEGELVWSDVVLLGFPVSGVVDKLVVQSGQKVSKGQLLVQLDQRPFVTDVKRMKARIDVISPQLFDAQLEFNQAEELFERTVLSEIELQKVELRLKGLQAQNQAAVTDHDTSLWKQMRASLTAPVNGVVIASDFMPGLIISEENKSAVYMKLATSGVMGVKVSLVANELSSLQVNQAVKVNVGAEQLDGQVNSITMTPDDNGRYTAIVKFQHDVSKNYYAGGRATVTY